MLQIGVVHEVQAALVAGVLLFKVQHQAQQGAHGGLGGRHVGKQARGRRGEGGREPIHGLPTDCPPILDEVSGGGIAVFEELAERREGDRQRLARRVPAPVERAAQRAQRRRRLVKAGGIGLADLLVLRDEGRQPVELGAPVVELLCGARQDLAAPGRLAHVAGALAQQRHLFCRPALGPGVALHLVIERQRQLREPPVVPPGAHGVRQQRKARQLLLLLVAALERAFQRGGLHGGGALLVGDPEVRAQSGAVGVFAQERGAEAVDRADPRAAHERALPAQAAAARIEGERLAQLPGDAAAQFSGGGLREGDDEEAVEVCRVRLVPDVAHEPFDEHLGLAAARARGDERGAAPALDGGGL